MFLTSVIYVIGLNLHPTIQKQTTRTTWNNFGKLLISQISRLVRRIDQHDICINDFYKFGLNFILNPSLLLYSLVLGAKYGNVDISRTREDNLNRTTGLESPCWN